jgi:hypothetical protein
MAKMSHLKVVAATSSFASRQRMMWPKTLYVRGLAASAPGRFYAPRAPLLLRVA